MTKYQRRLLTSSILAGAAATFGLAGNIDPSQLSGFIDVAFVLALAAWGVIVGSQEKE